MTATWRLVMIFNELSTWLILCKMFIEMYHVLLLIFPSRADSHWLSVTLSCSSKATAACSLSWPSTTQSYSCSAVDWQSATWSSKSLDCRKCPYNTSSLPDRERTCQRQTVAAARSKPQFALTVLINQKLATRRSHLFKSFDLNQKQGLSSRILVC